MLVRQGTAMAKTVEELETEVLQLAGEDRARLLRVLLLSLEETEDAEVARVWAEEAEARALQLERGEVEAIPSEEVFREARSRLK